MPKSVVPGIKDLYGKLKPLGIDRKYVQDAILPDWWDDSLYADESNRLTAHMSVARFLGVGLRDLDGALADFPRHQNVRLKCSKNAAFGEVTGSVAAATHIARLVASLMRDYLPFTGLRPALEIRNQLLARPECSAPDLANLVDHCWQHGIAVVHLTTLPKHSRKIAGLATYVDQRPVIVLCSGRDSPAWLAFHLAHELGHIMCGHVRPGGQPLVDIDIDSANDEVQEREADCYGIQVLTGHPELRLTGSLYLRPAELAVDAAAFGRSHRIDPGTVALVYGYSNERIAAAQAALKAMGEDSGAREILATSFRQHVPIEDAPESAQRHLAAVTQILGLSQAS